MTVRHTVVLAAMLVLAVPLTAQAVVIEYDFTGNITEEDTTGPLKNFLNPPPLGINPLSGYVRFDASTPDTTPGNWTLPAAIVHIAYQGGTVDGVGAVAHVSTNRDVFLFTFQIPVSQFLPVTIATAAVNIGFDTFQDGYFSLNSLPTTVPPNDHTISFSYTAGTTPFGASTDTNNNFTARTISVPEPASMFLLFVGAIAALFIPRLSDKINYKPR